MVDCKKLRIIGLFLAGLMGSVSAVYAMEEDKDTKGGIILSSSEQELDDGETAEEDKVLASRIRALKVWMEEDDADAAMTEEDEVAQQQSRILREAAEQDLGDGDTATTEEDEVLIQQSRALREGSDKFPTIELRAEDLETPQVLKPCTNYSFTISVPNTDHKK